jgi:DNA-binding NarL/FixJ family response regulator
VVRASTAREPSRLPVLLVDDHGMVRRCLRAYLAELDDVVVVGEAADGQDALDRLAGLAAAGQLPAVVLMDVVMPGMDGVTATAEIRRRHPDVEVIAMTSFVDEQLAHNVLRAGAAGYLSKDARPDAIAAAIRTAAQRLRPTPVRPRRPSSPPAPVSPRSHMEVRDGHDARDARFASGSRGDDDRGETP